MTVIQLIANKEWGGGERYALDLACALRDRGIYTLVYSRRSEAVCKPFMDKQLLYGYINAGGLFNVLAPVKLASVIRKLDDDVVIHVHNFKAAATALVARSLCADCGHKIKVVCTRHLVAPAKTDARHLHILSELDAIIFVSHLAYDTFCSTLPADFDRKRLHVIHNAIAAEPAIKASKPHKPLRLIFVGRIAPEKGIDTLIDALATIDPSEWRLKICGAGLQKTVTPLMKAAANHGIADNIEWTGHVEDITPHIDEADVLVAPSTWREPFGLVLLEGMARGKAIITTNNGAQPEIITDGCEGLLVPPADPAALAAAIKRLIDNPQECEALGKKALENFNSRWQYFDFVDKVLQVYGAK